MFASFGPSGIIWLWRVILLNVLCCRYNAVVIYVYSLLFYREELRATMPGWGLTMAYHFLGVGFSVLILNWSCLLKVWLGQVRFPAVARP